MKAHGLIERDGKQRASHLASKATETAPPFFVFRKDVLRFRRTVSIQHILELLLPLELSEKNRQIRVAEAWFSTFRPRTGRLAESLRAPATDFGSIWRREKLL
jgi:hypothetical protein